MAVARQDESSQLRTAGDWRDEETGRWGFGYIRS